MSIDHVSFQGIVKTMNVSVDMIRYLKGSSF